MKKTLLTFIFAIAATFAMAQTTTYTDNLVVTINGETSEPQKTTIYVEENTDGTYKLSLNNFILEGMPVGNIILDNIDATEENGIKSFNTIQKIEITAGDSEDEMWIGPMLGAIPVSINGKMDAENLYCSIDIDLTEAMGQVINVVFGNDFAANDNGAVTTYTDNLVVTINGETSEPQETTIYVEENTDGTYKLSLNNFILEGMPVGNIILDNIVATEENGIKYFETIQDIEITAGDSEDEMWIGPMLGAIPVSINGKMDSENLYCSIDIDLTEALGQVINVVFGEEDKVTSISNVTIENNTNTIYDLTGRKVNEITTAGIYIVNGKKVLVK